MGDELITGIFTLLGTFLGFGLVKISDWITARDERNKVRAALTFKLYKLREILTVNKTNIQETFPTITRLYELKAIQDLVIRSEIQKEFPKIEFLFEKLFTPDIKSPDIFINFSNLSIYLKSLLTIVDSNSESFPDQKPRVLTLFIVTIDVLNKIIDEIS
jgi:hypothetical protein